MIDFEKLKAPFDPKKISWRVGARTQDKRKGIALAYIDARDVMERLDEVCGPSNWQALYPHANGKTSCKIGIMVDKGLFQDNKFIHDPLWVWKENGAGDSDVEAEKGAFSDAFKRAAVLWGIGRYLYDLENVWVELKNEKYIQESEMPKLWASLEKLTGQKTLDAKGNGTISGRLADDPSIREDMANLGYEAQKIYNTAIAELDHCQDLDDLAALVKKNKDTGRMKGLPKNLKDDFTDSYAKIKLYLENKNGV